MSCSSETNLLRRVDYSRIVFLEVAQMQVIWIALCWRVRESAHGAERQWVNCESKSESPVAVLIFEPQGNIEEDVSFHVFLGRRQLAYRKLKRDGISLSSNHEFVVFGKHQFGHVAV